MLLYLAGDLTKNDDPGTIFTRTNVLRFQKISEFVGLAEQFMQTRLARFPKLGRDLLACVVCENVFEIRTALSHGMLRHDAGRRRHFDVSN